jgi:crotonobetainyl-CoA:carnitine CoA-transferase CaiB-like acyl-CoA transferase
MDGVKPLAGAGVSGGLLSGVRVIEAARILAGPFCGQTLGDLGAEVIKLERPGEGDDTRRWGPPFVGPLSAYFLACNRNKRSVTLDLMHPDGQAVLHRLLSVSDVLLENFRTDSLPKLHLTPAELLSRHPRLIVCSISGYGRTGPMAEVPGYDFAVQAQSGLMSITGPVAGPPCKVGVAVADVLTGLYAAVAVLAALHARQRSGHGYAIDLSLLDCAVAAQVNVAQAYLSTGRVPARQGNAHLQIVPYELFATADGWLVLNVGNDKQWAAFCQVAGVPHWADDPAYQTNQARVQHRDRLIPQVAQLLKQRPTAEWESLLAGAGVPHARVRDLAEVFADPQVLSRGMRVQVRDPHGQPVDLLGSVFHINGQAPPPPSMPPALGADTDAVLSRLLGLDAEQIARLRQANVV